MRLVCDESVHRSIVERLRARGHDVVFIAELSPSIPDEEVLAEANTRAAILITIDKDFGELVFRLRMLSAGVLLLRLHGVAPDDRPELVAATIDAHGSELPGHFGVLSAGKLRIREQLSN